MMLVLGFFLMLADAGASPCMSVVPEPRTGLLYTTQAVRLHACLHTKASAAPAP